MVIIVWRRKDGPCLYRAVPTPMHSWSSLRDRSHCANLTSYFTVQSNKLWVGLEKADMETLNYESSLFGPDKALSVRNCHGLISDFPHKLRGAPNPFPPLALPYYDTEHIVNGCRSVNFKTASCRVTYRKNVPLRRLYWSARTPDPVLISRAHHVMYYIYTPRMLIGPFTPDGRDKR